MSVVPDTLPAPDRAKRLASTASAVAAGAVEAEAAGRLRAAGVPRDAVPALVRALTDDGIDVYELRRLDPSLEDVYLALHGRATREPGTDAEVQR